MPYHSPLHIFDGKNLSDVDEASLKRLKKELLLQFDLHQQTTIRLNGQEYDKAGLLAAFDELKSDAEFHLRVYRNKDLLNFLEKGEVRFFENKKNRADWNDPVFWPWVEPFFIEKLGDTLFECAVQKGFTSVNRLRAIKKSEFQLTPQQKDRAYAKTFAHFDFYFTALKLKVLDPFIENSDCVFNQDTLELLHLHHLNVLKELPKEIFQPVIATYGRLANHVLGKTFYRDRRFSEFGSHTLHNLNNATIISLFNNPGDPEIERLAKAIRKEIYGSKTSEKGPAWQAFLAIIVIIVVIFRVTTCASKNRSHRNENIGIPLTQYVDNYVSDTDMLGEWETTFFLGKDSIHVRRNFKFTQGKKGKMTMLLLDRQGEEQCRLEVSFDWKIQALSRPTEALVDKKFIQFNYDKVPQFDRNCQQSPDSENAKAAAKIVSNFGIFKSFWVEPFTFDKSGWPHVMMLSREVYRRMD